MSRATGIDTRPAYLGVQSLIKFADFKKLLLRIFYVMSVETECLYMYHRVNHFLKLLQRIVYVSCLWT